MPIASSPAQFRFKARDRWYRRPDHHKRQGLCRRKPDSAAASLGEARSGRSGGQQRRSAVMFRSPHRMHLLARTRPSSIKPSPPPRRPYPFEPRKDPRFQYFSGSNRQVESSAFRSRPTKIHSKPIADLQKQTRRSAGRRGCQRNSLSLPNTPHLVTDSVKPTNVVLLDRATLPSAAGATLRSRARPWTRCAAMDHERKRAPPSAPPADLPSRACRPSAQSAQPCSLRRGDSLCSAPNSV